MKDFKICFLSVLMLLICSCHKDHRIAVPGEQPVDIYVYGSLWHGSSMYGPPSGDAVYYKNGVRVTLNAGENIDTSTNVLTINSLALSGDTVYAGGSREHGSYAATATLDPVYWINGMQHVLPVTNMPYPVIFGIASNGKNFYALYRDGRVFAESSSSGIAVNGSMKYEYNDYLYGLIVSGTDLYAYGNTTSGSNAIYYKNNQPVMFQLPANTSAASITGMCISGQDVYACGYLTKNNSNTPVYWKNGQLTMLTSGTYPYPTGIAVQGGDVYVSGYQLTGTNAFGLPEEQAILWKNGVMSTLSPTGSDSYTNGVTVVGNDVYVSGRAGPDSNATVYWKNGSPVNFKIPKGYAFVGSGIVVVPKK